MKTAHIPNTTADIFKFTFSPKAKKEVAQKYITPMCSTMKHLGIPFETVVENPYYRQYKDSFRKTPFHNWAVENLQRKGFEVSNPLKPANDSYDLYILTSDKALKAFDDQFQNIKGISRYLSDVFKTLGSGLKFQRKIQSQNDIHYKAASNVLFYGEVNKHQSNRFNEFLKKMNVTNIQVEDK